MRRVLQFDGLRALAFLSVFFCHAYKIPLLWMGVDLFFVLSGFLITGILLRMKQTEPDTYFRNFYLRRALRILPPYALFIAMVAVCLKIDWSGIWYWYAFFGANVAESLSRGGPNVLTPVWSLAVEEQFYLVWPLLVYFLSQRTLKRVLVGAIVVAPVLRGLATLVVSSHWPIYFLTPFRMDLLSAGSLLAVLWDRDQSRVNSWNRVAAWAMVAIACAFGSLSLNPGFRTGANTVLFNVLGYSLSAAFFASAVLCVLTMSKGAVYQVLTWRPLRYLGTISYMMYLVHGLMLKLAHDSGVRCYPLLALPATIAFSALSWHLLEHPILQCRPTGKQVVAGISGGGPLETIYAGDFLKAGPQ